MKFTKIKFAALTAGLIGVCAVCGGCGNNTADAEFAREEFYGVGAATCASILSANLDAYASGTFVAAVNAVVADTGEDVKQQAENFNKYFAALNSFLDDSAFKVETTENTDAEYSAYAVKLTVGGKDIAGNTTEYVMYYNETFMNREVDEDEVEEVYSVEGVMLSGEGEYRISGGKKIETEDGEREEELKIRAYIGENAGNYVEMKQEYSVENGETETEYVYRIYSDNKLVEETSVEFETETKNEKKETEFELEFRKGGAKGKYKVEREEKGGVTEITVKYDIDGKKGKFEIKEIVKDGVPCYVYTFEDNSTRIIEK